MVSVAVWAEVCTDGRIVVGFVESEVSVGGESSECSIGGLLIGEAAFLVLFAVGGFGVGTGFRLSVGWHRLSFCLGVVCLLVTQPVCSISKRRQSPRAPFVQQHGRGFLLVSPCCFLGFAVP